MAVQINDISLNRDDLAEFLPNLRSIKAFENLQKALSGTIPDAINGAPTDVNTLLPSRAFGQPPLPRAPDVRGDQYVDVTRDALGYQIALVPERLIVAILPFIPRQAAASTSATAPTVDANLILATQIFGA